MKLGRLEGPLYNDSSLGITPPTFIPLVEPFELIEWGGSGLGIRV